MLIIGIIFFFPTVIVLSVIVVGYVKEFRWSRGTFPNTSYNPKHRFEAYLSLTMNLIACDRFGQMKKLSYFHSYARRIHKVDRDAFEDIIDRNFRFPISAESTCAWLNRHESEQQKREFILFLLSISLMENGLTKSEYDCLHFICIKLGLTKFFLDAEIDQRTRAEEKSRREERPSISKRDLCLQILHLEKNATNQEIKATYRNLVKKLHPDRFVNDSVERQAQAHQRFIEVQEAYEYLIQ